ncbi:MAG: FAD:protein FMN transferase [Gaiellaceae bacterium]
MDLPRAHRGCERSTFENRGRSPQRRRREAACSRGGELQHHLIDPRRGRPAVSRWDEVTVAAESCLAADVAAKAAFLLSDDGPGWLDERGLPGRFRAGGELEANDAWIHALGEPLAA